MLEQEPEPPSSAARRATLGAPAVESGLDGGAVDAPDARDARDTEIRLGRDLDAICLKALCKEPHARYASVAALAQDLRLLLAGLPVLARRGGLTYRLMKLARRYSIHLAVAAAAALLATLFVLLVVRSSGSRPMALDAPPTPPRPRPTLSRIGDLSARFAENPGQPEIGLELIAALLAVGRGDDAMGAVARLRQLPGELGKGPRVDLAEAEAALAVSEFQRAASAAGLALAGAERAKDAALARRARVAQAEEAGRLVAEAMPRARALGDKHLEIEALTLRGRLEAESGAVDRGLGTIEIALALAGEEGDVASEASALVVKMALLNWSGDDIGAAAVGKLAIQRLRLSGDREQLLTVLANTAIQHIERAQFAEAEAAIAEAEPIARSVGSPRHRGSILRARGYLEEQRGDKSAARASYTAAVAAGREAGVDSVLAIYLNDLAWLELNDSRFDAAAIASEEAVELYRRGGDERGARGRSSPRMRRRCDRPRRPRPRAARCFGERGGRE